MKDAMYKDFTKRFSSIYNVKIYFIATILDPRFKTIFFSIQSISNFYRQKLLLVCFDSNPGEIINSSSLEKDNQNMEIKEIPSTSAMDSTGIFSLWGSYADVVKDNEKSNNITSVNCPYSLEIENYLNEPVFKALNDNTPADPLKYWAVNCQKYPTLSKLARQYLATPATSISSESVFSEAGDIDSPHRRRLTSDKLEILVFLKRNLRYINFKY
ncbi:unnamed protein product [Gordionus sp. m RMFG-2023]